MSQPRILSAVESVANVAVGLGVAFMAQLIVFPALHIAVSLEQNVQIAAIFTVVSLVRGYVIRRLFNWIHNNHR